VPVRSGDRLVAAPLPLIPRDRAVDAVPPAIAAAPATDTGETADEVTDEPAEVVR
jgi:two-component system sensor histidine kinase MtrB